MAKRDAVVGLRRCAATVPIVMCNLAAGDNELIFQESIYSQFKINQDSFGFLGPPLKLCCK